MRIGCAAGLMLLLIAPSQGAQVDEWLQQMEHPRYPIFALRQEDALDRYVSHDFSSLLIPRSQFLGYIGDDYRRLRIRINNVHRKPDRENLYLVTGVSEVAGAPGEFPYNDFRGTITVVQVREYKSMHYGVDEFYKSERPKAEGVLIGRYRFEEERSRPNSGVFEGIVTLNWVLDRYGVVQYDDIESQSSDNYRNNQYVGTWTSFISGKTKIANWGEQRIPFSGDLDMGAGEFSANPKYRDRGWPESRP
jgi:hypothetical protein